MQEKRARQLRFESLEWRRLLTGATGAVGLASHAALLVGATALSASAAPLAAQVSIDLSHWNLTLPTGAIGHPTIISTANLLHGYSSPYFSKGAGGALVFWCPVTGVATGGSLYPRAELREASPNGGPYNWTVAAGTATLSATLAVNRVPSTGKLVVGQIHGNGAGGVKSEPLVMLDYVYDSAAGTGKLIAEVRATPVTPASGVIVATDIPLNGTFSYTIQLQANLTLSVQVNGVTKYSQPIDPSWKTQGLYFKAGVYCLDNSGLATDGAQATFYALAATHA